MQTLLSRHLLAGALSRWRDNRRGAWAVLLPEDDWLDICAGPGHTRLLSIIVDWRIADFRPPGTLAAASLTGSDVHCAGRRFALEGLCIELRAAAATVVGFGNLS